MTELNELILKTAAAFLFGSMIGSFLNVVIYRLPRRVSLVWPGSKCPHCYTSIKWYDNVPILGYVFLRGKCRHCSKRISPRYPAVEAVTAVLFAVLFWQNGFTHQYFAWLLLGSILIATAMIDLDYMIIPNRITYPSMIAGLAFAAPYGYYGFLKSFHGAIVGILILAFMYYLGKLLFRRESLGFGDFKLVVVMGIFLGPFWTLLALILAVVSGGVVGVGLIVAGKKETGQEVPFGPYLALGGLCALVFRRQLLFLVEQYMGML